MKLQKKASQAVHSFLSLSFPLSYTIDSASYLMCAHMECKVKRIILILWGLLKCFSDVNCDFLFFFVNVFPFCERIWNDNHAKFNCFMAHFFLYLLSFKRFLN